ncbi:MAG: DMT family transporter [Clostridiaceae bacterium]
MYKDIRTYLELTISMAIVGSSVVIGKIISGRLPIFLSQSLSLTVALIILIPLVIKCEGGIPRLGKSDILILFLQSLFGMFLFRVFLLYGLKYTTAVEGGIITSTTPIVIAILSFVFLKEKLSIGKLFGAVLSVGGIILVNLTNLNLDSLNRTNFILGNLLVFGAVLGESLFTVLRKRVHINKVTTMLSVTVVVIFSLIMFTPVAIIEAYNFDFSLLQISDFVIISYYGIFVTIVAYYLWFLGVSKVSASTAGIYTAIAPVSTLILSFILIKEQILERHVIGIVLVIIGIVVSSRDENKLVTFSRE